MSDTEVKKFHPDGVQEGDIQLMQSLCGGGGTFRVFLGGEQIARVTAKQLGKFFKDYENIKAWYVGLPENKKEETPELAD